MKVLLIEDRKERQQSFMKKFNFDLENFSNILFNALDEKYEKIFENLKNEKYDFLDEFDVIISHKSAFDDFIVSKLKKFAEKSYKKLVFFSGGIDTVYYSKKNEFEFLQLNSMLFYGKNLKVFLDYLKNNEIHLLSLAYGKKWKLNILIEILDKVVLFENRKEEDIVFDDFIEETKIDRLDMQLENNIDFISKQEINKIKTNINSMIESLVNE